MQTTRNTAPDHDVLCVTASSNVMTLRPHDPPISDSVTRKMLAADPVLDTLDVYLHESTYVECGKALAGLSAEIGDPREDLVA